MFLTLDLTSDIPLYQQIHDRIVEAIATGQLAPDEALPSSRQLADDFGINFHTVDKAYDLLRRGGYVQRARKRGTVVLARASPQGEARYPRDWDDRARTLLAEATAQGLSAEEIVGRCRQILATFGAAAAAPNPEEGQS